MFDESFRISRTYFAIIQVLRVASNMVDDVLRQWTNLRDKWDAVVPRSGMFDADDLAAAGHNWDVITASLKSKAKRVQSQISRKNEAVISLRDGVRRFPEFAPINCICTRRKAHELTRNMDSYSTQPFFGSHRRELLSTEQVYVFTIVTVLYTPLGFLAVSRNQIVVIKRRQWLSLTRHRRFGRCQCSTTPLRVPMKPLRHPLSQMASRLRSSPCRCSHTFFQ